jgi:hypothetical protein
MSVKNLTIDRRQTNEKEDIVYAVIDMEDSYVHRTAYYLFTINYYNKGGWMIEKWKQYQDTTSYPLSCPAENMANDVISEQYKSYTLKSVDANDLVDGKCTYVFDINDARRYVAISGQAEVVFSLNSNGDYLKWSSSSVNDSGIAAKWDIAGKWTARMHSVFDYLFDTTVETSVNITKVTDTTFHLNGELILLSSDQPRTRYSLNGDLNLLSQSQPRQYPLNEIGLYYDNKNQQLSIVYRLHDNYNTCEFRFTADEASFACHVSYSSYSGPYTLMSRN